MKNIWHLKIAYFLEYHWSDMVYCNILKGQNKLIDFLMTHNFVKSWQNDQFGCINYFVSWNKSHLI